MSTRLILWLVLICAGVSTSAGPRFAAIFADHHVLQRQVPVRVWGFGAETGASVVIRFGEVETKAVVSASGDWEALLPAMTASSTGRDLRLLVSGREVAAVADVLVGEVWLAAGQSNMQFPVRAMVRDWPAAGEWMEAAEAPAIRFRRINDPVLPSRDREAPDLSVAESWKVMTPQSVAGFSAVAAVFAREVHEALEVPVGVIDVSWGGKPIEPFIPREMFATPLLRQVLDLADAERLDELAGLRGGVIIRNPEGHPGAIFNARMAPLTRFPLRGFLWYQAESNAGRGEDPRGYRHKMEALVRGWRSRWHRTDLPVHSVQLPSFPPATGWIRMREEQRRALAIPNTSMAVTIDIRGEGIHPPDKLCVGRRLAALALEQGAHPGRKAGGPVYRTHRARGGEVWVEFDRVEGGLMVGDRPMGGPVQPTPDVAPRWFEIAGEDRVWHPAAARIEDRQVVLSSPAVQLPVAVRYACHTRPQGGNLYNRAGWPASPFCSHLEWLGWEDPR